MPCVLKNTADNAAVKEVAKELSAMEAPPGLTPDALAKLPANAESPEIEKFSPPVVGLAYLAYIDCASWLIDSDLELLIFVFFG